MNHSFSLWKGFNRSRVLDGKRNARAKANCINELVRCMTLWPLHHGFSDGRGNSWAARWKHIRTTRRGGDINWLIKNTLHEFGLVEKSNQGVFKKKIIKALKPAFRAAKKRSKTDGWRHRRQDARVSDVTYARITRKLKMRMAKGCIWTLNRWADWFRTAMKKYDSHVRRPFKDVQALLLEATGVSLRAGSRAPKPRKRLTIQSVNVDGLANLSMLVDDSKAEAILLQETRSPRGYWPNKANGWSIINFPRPAHATGGGVGLAYKNSLGNVKHLETMDYRYETGDVKTEHGKGAQWAWMRIPVQNGAVYVCSVYIPPTHTVWPSMRKTMASHITSCYHRQDCCGVLVAGDLNATLVSEAYARGRQWGGLSKTQLRSGRRWRRTFSDLGGKILNLEKPTATHSQGTTSSMIDYAVWFGNEQLCLGMDVIPTNTGHCTLSVRLDAAVRRVSFEPQPRFYRLSDDSKCRDFKAKFDEESIPHDLCYGAWCKRIFVVGYSVLGKTRRRDDTSNSRWWNDDLQRLARVSKRLRRKKFNLMLRGKPHSITVRELAENGIEYRRARAVAKREYWRDLRRKWDGTPKTMREAYKLVRSVTKRKTGRKIGHSRAVMEAAWGPIVGNKPPPTCTNEAERKWLKSQHWASFRQRDRVKLDELKAVIKCLPKRKAPGRDGIANIVLASLPDSMLHPLVWLFNSVLADPDHIPAGWFIANVCLIPKVDDPDALQFRPITLLSCVAKLLEKLLWERVKLLNIKLAFNQGGFVAERGCAEQAWRMATLDQMLRMRQLNGLSLFLDLKKAFDTAPIDIVIGKLRKNFPDLPHYFIKFCWRWMSGHKRCLLVDDTDPTPLPVARGVPQGSILSPFLFNCFINDLIVLLDDNCAFDVKIDMANHQFSAFGYADDIGQSGLIDSKLGRSPSMDLAIEHCIEWATDNGMVFAPSKCQLLRIGRISKKHTDIDVEFGTDTISLTDKATYLGVRFKEGGQARLDNSSACSDLQAFLDTRYTMLEATEGCAVTVGSIIATSIYVPKLLYGCEIYPVNARKVKTMFGKLGKKILCAYDTDSNTAVNEYLGWRSVDDWVRARVVRFVFKVALCRFPTLTSWLLSIIDKDIHWSKYARSEFLSAVDDGLITSDPRVNGDFCSWLADKKQAKENLAEFVQRFSDTKPVPHPIVVHAPHLAHFGFIFVRGYLNPRNSRTDADGKLDCYLCSQAGGDCVAHLLTCPVTNAIIADGASQLGVSRPDFRTLLRNIGNPDTDSKAAAVLAETCRRLWQARVAKRREAKLGANATDDDNDSDSDSGSLYSQGNNDTDSDSDDSKAPLAQPNNSNNSLRHGRRARTLGDLINESDGDDSESSTDNVATTRGHGHSRLEVFQILSNSIEADAEPDA